jgi:hypothetical protein
MSEPSPQQPGEAPAEEKDIQERIDGFNKEVGPLLGKYELGLAALPRIAPNGLIVADPIVVSVRNRPDLKATGDGKAPAAGLTKPE